MQCLFQYGGTNEKIKYCEDRLLGSQGNCGGISRVKCLSFLSLHQCNANFAIYQTNNNWSLGQPNKASDRRTLTKLVANHFLLSPI